MPKCPNCAWYQRFSVISNNGCQHEEHKHGVSRDCKDFADKSKYRLVRKDKSDTK